MVDKRGMFVVNHKRAVVQFLLFFFFGGYGYPEDMNHRKANDFSIPFVVLVETAD